MSAFVRIRPHPAQESSQASGSNGSGSPASGADNEARCHSAIADRRTLAAVRAVELQARLARLKHRLPPAAEDAAAALRAEIERRQARGRALARKWQRLHDLIP